MSKRDDKKLAQWAGREALPVLQARIRELEGELAFERKTSDLLRDENVQVHREIRELAAALQHIVRAAAPGVDQSDDELEAFIANVREIASAALAKAGL